MEKCNCDAFREKSQSSLRDRLPGRVKGHPLIGTRSWQSAWHSWKMDLRANREFLKVAPELLEQYDRYTAARKEGKKKEAFSTQMLMLNAVEQADSKC